MMDFPGLASSKESSDGPRLWSTPVPGTSKTSESASASIAASDCTAAAGADRESSCEDAPLASRSQNHFTFSDPSRRILGRKSPSCHSVVEATDSHCQALQRSSGRFPLVQAAGRSLLHLQRAFRDVGSKDGPVKAQFRKMFLICRTLTSGADGH